MERYRFEDHIREAFENLQQPLAICQFIDYKPVMLALSDGFCQMFGYKERSRAYHDMNHNIFKDFHPEDAKRVERKILEFEREDGGFEELFRLQTGHDDGYKVIQASAKHVHTETGACLTHVWFTQNNYNNITGLPGLTYFFDLAETGKESLLKGGKEPVFLYFDMSGMKYYNKIHGFAGGDRLLKCFAGLLVNTFGSGNCCHIGGDHFAAYGKEENMTEILDRFFLACKDLNDGENLPVRVGIYSNSMEDVPVSTACDRAKFACDQIKNTYASRYNYYDKKLRDDFVMRQYISLNFDRALEQGWIEVYYQPIVRAVNTRICDEEALARWNDPDKGFLSAADFIPYLEDSGQIYKLDLYVLDRILEKIKGMEASGLHVVPQSLNLSRSDFDACDIVEEVRKRVDTAGVNHNMITIEITESTLANQLDFMLTQLERFQALGFPVWMDDFGSGYSSMDMLQIFNFNLIKFDMSFLRRLDQGKEGKIILTELMRMANALGVDTVSEGVETVEQARFLRDIGCSKLQGYYYSRPAPLEKILKYMENENHIKYENPSESSYFDTIGRVNLYDLSVIANEEENIFQNLFDTLPIAIMELSKDDARFIRANEAYRDFMMHFFGYDLSDENALFTANPSGKGSTFMDMVWETSKSGKPAFVDEKMPDGTMIHSFARRIDINPVTGDIAVAVVVLSVTDSSGIFLLKREENQKPGQVTEKEKHGKGR